MTKTNKYLAGIILLAVAVSLFYSFYFKNKPVVDAKRYDAIAVNLIEGHGYRIDLGLSFDKDIAIALVGPGYEFFLAGVYYIFGHNIMIVWFLQAMMLGGTGWLVFLISRRVFKKEWHPTIGLLAAILTAFSPDLILASSMLFTEILGIFLMVLSIYLFYRYQDDYKSCVMVLMALALGGAAMTRSVLILLTAVFVVYLLVRKKWAHLSIFILILIAMISPWAYRNWRVYHKIIPFSVTGQIDLWWGNHEGASGELDAFLPIANLFVEKGPIATSEISQKNGNAYIFHHPIVFGKLVLKRLSIYFSFIRPTGWWPYPGGHGYNGGLIRVITLLASSLYSIILFTLGFGGIWQTLKNKSQKEHWINIKYLLIILGLMPLPVLAFFVESRYRYGIYPLMAVFAAYFLHALTLEKKWYYNKILIYVFAILSLNSLFDIIVNFSRILERIK